NPSCWLYCYGSNPVFVRGNAWGWRYSYPMWISFITTVIIRVPIAYTIAHLTKSEAYPTGRPESVFVSLLMSWVFGAIINLAFYKGGKWRKKTLVPEEVPSFAN